MNGKSERATTVRDGTTGRLSLETLEVLVWSEKGRFLITGEPGAVDDFVTRLEPARRMRISDVGPGDNEV